MKKVLFFILIIASLGLLAGVPRAKSADPEGTCIYQTAEGAQTMEEGYTQTGCSAYINALNALEGETKYFAGTPQWWIAYSETRPDPRKQCGSNQEWDGEKCVDKDTGSGGDPIPPSTGTTSYNLLSPLPCPPGEFNCSEDGVLDVYVFSDSKNLSKYFNLMIVVFIGICGVMAVVVIVIGGLEYMTSELPGNKENAKHRITGAIFGLVLAGGAWTILYQINPLLLVADIGFIGTCEIAGQPPIATTEEDCKKQGGSWSDKLSVSVKLTADEANYARTEGAASKVGNKYTTAGSLSVGVADFVNTSCSSLSKIEVNTGAKTANFCAGNTCVSVPINVGFNGVSEPGQAKSGDGKTPKGTTTITGDRRIKGGGNAVISNGGFNLGPAFINVGATANGKDRGIGFHGSYNNNLGTTNGCIRMRNDDIIALAPCMKSGTSVVIQ